MEITRLRKGEQETMMIETDNGQQIEVYRNAIERIASEYVAQLDDPTDIKNPMVWRGCLLSVYNELFKPTENLQYNRKSNIDTSNPDIIWKLWNVFCDVSFKYRHYISIGRFALMTGIDKHTMCNWGAGRSREANPAYFSLYKNMMSDCESCLEDMATESNGIGAIFNLKSKHNWREASPIPTEQMIDTTARLTPEQIAQKYRDVPKPTLIDMEDD